MEDEQLYPSRLNRYEKKRKNTKWLTLFVVVGTILIFTLISIVIFTDSDEDNTEDAQEEMVDSKEENDQNDDDSLDEDQEEIEDANENADDLVSDPVDQEQPNDSSDDFVEQNPDDFDREIISSDDENVDYAYTSNWAPIPTVQEEPHEITWDQSSVDWNEMMRAASLATGVAVDDIYYVWVSGNGPQSVIATFTNSANLDEHFRVYITWVENQGWQPERVDVLHSHDEMHRFGSDSTEDNDEQGEE